MMVAEPPFVVDDDEHEINTRRDIRGGTVEIMCSPSYRSMLLYAGWASTEYCPICGRKLEISMRDPEGGEG